MIITPLNVSNSVASVSLQGSTMDMLTYFQALLLKDADSQLKDLGKKMQANLELKQNYRKAINAYEIAINRIKTEGEGKDDKKEIEFNSVDEALTQLGLDSVSNGSHTGALVDYTYNTEANNGLGGIIEVDADMNMWPLKQIPHATDDGGTRYTYKAIASRLEASVKYLTNKQENLNTESEQLGLQLQDLTGKRKSALDTLSGLFSKISDTNGGIIRNISK